MAQPEAAGRDVVARCVSRETLARLDTFHALLTHWAPRVNLVGASTVRAFWIRHVLDSLQLLDLAPESALTWIDIGSGAGFPGLPIAAALAERPGGVVRLVEPNHKRAAFLREAVRAMHVPAEVIARGIEATPVAPTDVLIARAVAPLDRLLTLVEPHLAQARHALFPKGRDVENELTEAALRWKLDLRLHQSRSDPRGVVLVINGASRV